jgi:hypothetical protein
MRKQKLTIEQKWYQQAETYRQQAAKLPYGKERDELLRMVRQLETASRMNDWLSSPELRRPE